MSETVLQKCSKEQSVESGKVTDKIKCEVSIKEEDEDIKSMQRENRLTSIIDQLRYQNMSKGELYAFMNEI
ncbi:unnamed protein product [Colias eurytheme]|nr:unnamed protein product [Colias eurytheme]